jgi:hypothetical protein
MVDFAKSVSVPISPKRAIIYLAALLLGIGIPLGLIYIYFMLDTKINTKKDVEAVVKDIPVIAEIPHIADIEKMVKYLDRSVLSESFRMLRTNLNFLIKDSKQSQVIFTTSTIKGEGKTFVSMNLAITLSTLGKKVILVGADLRNPQLHKMLNISRHQRGVTNYLHDTVTKIDDIIENGSHFIARLGECGTVNASNAFPPLEPPDGSSTLTPGFLAPLGWISEESNSYVPVGYKSITLWRCYTNFSFYSVTGSCATSDVNQTLLGYAYQQI